MPSPDFRALAPKFVVTDSFAGSPARRIGGMSIMVWKVLRRLPKLLLLVLTLFLLATVARA